MLSWLWSNLLQILVLLLGLFNWLVRSLFQWQFLIIYIFSVSLKFWACCIKHQWGEFTVKNPTLHLHILSWHFFCLSSKNLCHHFHFFFWWGIKFPKQNIKQLETRIGDKKLSVELYVRKKKLKTKFVSRLRNLLNMILLSIFKSMFYWFERHDSCNKRDVKHVQLNKINWNNFQNSYVTEHSHLLLPEAEVQRCSVKWCSENFRKVH